MNNRTETKKVSDWQTKWNTAIERHRMNMTMLSPFNVIDANDASKKNVTAYTIPIGSPCFYSNAVMQLKNTKKKTRTFAKPCCYSVAVIWLWTTGVWNGLDRPFIHVTLIQWQWCDWWRRLFQRLLQLATNTRFRWRRFPVTCGSHRGRPHEYGPAGVLPRGKLIQ